MSNRERRRAQRQNLTRSAVLAGLGILVVALVIVPGQSFWHTMRSWLFGSFGIITYLVGPFLLYLAYLLASGYRVGRFVGKVVLMAILLASLPVIFSSFKVGDTVWQTVKILFAWGQRKFWTGGVLGLPIGATLLAVCGRPGANILMLIVLAVGLMVFFAVTPVDVVQFVSYYIQQFREKQAARAAEDTAYDTQLFGTEAEEEPLENLTGTLPDPTPRPAVQHRAFDVAPYLEQEEAARRGRTQPETARPAAQTAQAAAPTQPIPAVRPDFDVDLGPDASQRALENAVQHDPLQKIEIGPGGTFGLDPLEQLNHKKKPAPAPKPQPQPEPEPSFELHLEPEPETQPEEDGDLDDLIRRAADGRRSAGVRQPEPEEFETPLVMEPDYAAPQQAESFETPLTPVEESPAPAAPQPASRPTMDVIPTLGGSFDDEDRYDPAKAAWNAGVPVSELLAGHVDLSARPAAGTTQNSARLTVSEQQGNSASAPISSPPNAAKASAEAQAAALEAKEEPRPYCYPSLNLFNASAPEDESGAVREMKKNADILVNTLDSFGVKTHILDICRGPSVTRYELQPQAGIKVSRITSLADDIALNLATAGVRIEAPIPGKPAVGIEVPNRIRTTVSIRSVFESQNYINMRSPLTMALGKDIAGTAQVADLCKMPHLLIAGSTGSGKSVCVNSIIISFLFRSGPEDVKLILIDPKVVELAEYNGIPHLLMPVVTEPRKAAGALGASVAEMERRYKLFAENNVRDIKSYNKLAKQNPVLEHLPYIAIIIDELADLMMVAGKEVEDYICRIAQKARAAGIHLIVATQRPSVDVITGLIKANIPSRIAFAVSSQIDSRTILDGGGAEKLLGNGDMLFLPVGASKPVRVQGTFVTDEEISAVLNFIKSTSSAQYDEDMIAEMERRAVAEKGSRKGESGDDGDEAGSHDPMFEQAVECVIEAGQASTSLLQRRCKLGYARAARIMDQMEQEKIIGPYEGAKPRAVLITQSQWQERKLNGGADA
ncbi:MAG: DNA translocase FtsK [Gemmiger sp.]|uniref:FtsK/SpoIIIE family DNA translocase n=1 Tax=Gemmiger sp. TaxID=2049027 RepID=UPI002E77DF16|nr:DNA translocase FtsK 4TM domain-containing protein [Gemmiger sp.]MEE0801912.1 DNA translocase FtsK [Gemmiger sp.]